VLDLRAVSLVVNGLILALALGIMLILLWHDRQKRSVQFSAVFLMLVIVWNSGGLILQLSQLVTTNAGLRQLAEGIFDLGLAGSAVSLYVLVTHMSGAHSARFRTLAFASLSLVTAQHVVLIVSSSTQNLGSLTEVADTADVLTRRVLSLNLLYFTIYGSLALFIVWRYRRKIRNRWAIIGTTIFVVGQGMTFLNPEIALVAFSTNVSSVGCLCIGLAVLRYEIILPLAERNTQVESLHKVSIAISGQLSLDTVLNEIATQAAGWLNADGVAIFLRDQDELELVTTHQLPAEMLKQRARWGRGMVGQVAQTQRSALVENYGRDWQGEADLPLAKETFGAAIAVPLNYGEQVTGVLLVIAGRQGRLFNPNDVYLLELLSTQAAVAIANSRYVTQLKELDRVKSEMVRMASHDLKNPLMGAMLYLDIARDAVSSANLTEALDIIDQQLERMNRIIRGVLDLEKMRMLSPGSGLCDGGKLVVRVYDQMIRLAADSKIRLAISRSQDKAMFQGDAEQIERALVNLVENAIKFTPREGEVDLGVTVADGEVTFIVRDTGVGIPPDIQALVFERFYRGQQAGIEHVTGSGLGLSIVKTVVENHGGRVWLESQEGRGTTFFIALKQAEVSQGEIAI